MHRTAQTLLASFGLALALAAPAFAATAVDINHADAKTLANSLDGVGQAKAEAIVAWRKTHGPFHSADDLTRVKGIGKSLVARNRSAIQLGEAGAHPPRPATTK